MESCRVEGEGGGGGGGRGGRGGGNGEQRGVGEENGGDLCGYEVVFRLGTSQDYMLVELQGTVDAEGSSLATEDLGELHISEKGVPTLKIGNHLLEGKAVVLSKPLLITSKQHLKDQQVGYSVVGVIKHKYLFKNRPKIVL